MTAQLQVVVGLLAVSLWLCTEATMVPTAAAPPLFLAATEYTASGGSAHPSASFPYVLPKDATVLSTAAQNGKHIW